MNNAIISREQVFVVNGVITSVSGVKTYDWR